MPNNRFYKNTITDADIPNNLTSAPTSILFHAYLTDDGTDNTLNENYAAATDCYYTAGHPVVVKSVVIEAVDGDIAQNAINNHEGFVGATAALTNGYKFLVETSAGSTLLDITNTIPLISLYQIDAISTFVRETFAAGDATTGNNHHCYTAEIDLEYLFGRAIRLNTGDRFVCVLQDNFTGLTFHRIHIFGYQL